MQFISEWKYLLSTYYQYLAKLSCSSNLSLLSVFIFLIFPFLSIVNFQQMMRALDNIPNHCINSGHSKTNMSKSQQMNKEGAIIISFLQVSYWQRHLAANFIHHRGQLMLFLLTFCHVTPQEQVQPFNQIYFKTISQLHFKKVCIHIYHIN